MSLKGYNLHYYHQFPFPLFISSEQYIFEKIKWSLTLTAALDILFGGIWCLETEGGIHAKQDIPPEEIPRFELNREKCTEKAKLRQSVKEIKKENRGKKVGEVGETFY